MAQPAEPAQPERRKLRQAQRERLRANHVGTYRQTRSSGTSSAALEVDSRRLDPDADADVQALAKLKELRENLEARGELEALTSEEKIALEAAPVDKVQVQLKRVEAEDPASPQLPISTGGMCLPPNLARGLLPNEVLSQAHVPPVSPSATPWQLRQVGQMPRPLPGTVSSMYPSDYSSMWSQLQHQASAPGVPVAPIQTSYQSVLTQTVGPAAMDVEAYCSIKDFGREIAEGRNAYSTQSREVVLPPGRPDYGRQVAKLELPPANVFGRQAQMVARQRLDAAIETNVNLREALQRNVQRMQRAIPRQRGEEVPSRPDSPRSGGSSPRNGSPPKGAYHKVKLEIEVVKASDIPDAAILATCDPYVIVSIVDGNPLQDSKALKDFEEWRALHEQWSGQTRVIEGTRDPDFRARFRAEVRNRETTHIHFRLLDQDNISHADRNIGQAVLPLQDLFDDSWAAVRAIALRPMDRKDAHAWAAISKTRLHVAVTWEGILGKVKSEERLRAAAHWKAGATHAKRAQRKANEEGTGEGLLDFFT